MKKREVIYYQDELNDEFSTAEITAKRIDDSYVYEKKGPVHAFLRFFWYRIVAPLPAFLYVKIALHQKTIGREKLKPFRKTGVFLYGNHTQQVGDPLTPNVFCFPKKVSFIVHPNNVSMPVLGRINPYLGAIPLPDTLSAYKRYFACMENRIKKGHAVVIYPEAHIWPYYTKIRPFPDSSFAYPSNLQAPVFCFVNTYRKQKHGKKPKMITYIEGPFFPDPDLSLRMRKKALRDEIYHTMVELASRSNAEYIQYVKQEGDTERG